MTMLPTPTGRDRVLAVLSGHGDDSAAREMASRLITGSGWSPATGLAEGLLACDAALAVVDGDAGIDPAFTARWESLSGNHVPRVIVAVNSVAGRADFSEVAAILERVTGDDIVCRYLPLADDDETRAVGVLDVLAGEVTTLDGEHRAADPEHISLTSEENELLIDLLAHAVLDDRQLEAYLDGAPVSLPALRDGYAASCASGDDLVALLLSEPELGGTPLRAILDQVTPTWSPIVQTPSGAVDIADVDGCLGIGIDDGVARVWNCRVECVCEVVDADGRVTGRVRVEGAVVEDAAIHAGDTIRPVGSSLVVRAPGL